jgi:hypothetical protein
MKAQGAETAISPPRCPSPTIVMKIHADSEKKTNDKSFKVFEGSGNSEVSPSVG